MTFNMQYSFTLIVVGPGSCGKYTFVIRLLECKDLLGNIVFANILWWHSENNAPQHLKNVSLVIGVPDVENPEHVPTIMLLDDLMESA